MVDILAVFARVGLTAGEFGPAVFRMIRNSRGGIYLSDR
jgi:hypothetical protein